MPTITQTEEATNRERLLMVAAKAGLKRKDWRKIEHILAKYSKPRVNAHGPDILRYGDGCLANGTMPWTGATTAKYDEDAAAVPRHIHNAMVALAAKKAAAE